MQNYESSNLETIKNVSRRIIYECIQMYYCETSEAGTTTPRGYCLVVAGGILAKDCKNMGEAFLTVIVFWCLF